MRIAPIALTACALACAVGCRTTKDVLDDYERSRRLDYVTASLLRRDKEMMKPKTDKKA